MKPTVVVLYADDKTWSRLKEMWAEDDREVLIDEEEYDERQ